MTTMTLTNPKAGALPALSDDAELAGLLVRHQELKAALAAEEQRAADIGAAIATASRRGTAAPTLPAVPAGRGADAVRAAARAAVGGAATVEALADELKLARESAALLTGELRDVQRLGREALRAQQRRITAAAVEQDRPLAAELARTIRHMLAAHEARFKVLREVRQRRYEDAFTSAFGEGLGPDDYAPLQLGSGAALAAIKHGGTAVLQEVSGYGDLEAYVCEEE